jgi:hypothetical protein
MKQKQDTQRRGGVATHTVRTADGRHVELRLTRKLAMACMCTECLGFESDPAGCTSRFCPLYPFRVKTLATKTGIKT